MHNNICEQLKKSSQNQGGLTGIQPPPPLLKSPPPPRPNPHPCLAPLYIAIH